MKEEERRAGEGEWEEINSFSQVSRRLKPLVVSP